jgi:hypothetical protein
MAGGSLPGRCWLQSSFLQYCLWCFFYDLMVTVISTPCCCYAADAAANKKKENNDMHLVSSIHHTVQT